MNLAIFSLPCANTVMRSVTSKPFSLRIVCTLLMISRTKPSSISSGVNTVEIATVTPPSRCAAKTFRLRHFLRLNLPERSVTSPEDSASFQAFVFIQLVLLLHGPFSLSKRCSDFLSSVCRISDREL